MHSFQSCSGVRDFNDLGFRNPGWCHVGALYAFRVGCLDGFRVGRLDGFRVGRRDGLFLITDENPRLDETQDKLSAMTEI